MRHATPETLDRLEPLLTQLRLVVGLRERTRGTFYLKSRAFLHFHEDPGGDFADLKQDGVWRRLGVSSAVDRRALLRAVRRLAG